jgi:hypothetical protein
VTGYVEPVPEFYARLLALTRMTRNGLTDLKVLDMASTARLSNLEGLIRRLLDISERELADRPLTGRDYDFIRDFGEALQGVVVAPEAGQAVARAMKTTLVADIHTDQNSGQVLEEGLAMWISACSFTGGLTAAW